MNTQSVRPLYQLERVQLHRTEQFDRSGIVDLRCNPHGAVFVATPQGVFSVDETHCMPEQVRIEGLLPDGTWEIRCFDFFPDGRMLVVMKKPNNDGMLKVIGTQCVVEREFHVRSETFMCCSDFSVDADGDILVTAQNKVLKIPKEKLVPGSEEPMQPDLEVVCVSDDSFTTCGCVCDSTFIYIADVNRIVKYSKNAKTFNYVAGDGRFDSIDGFGCNAAFQEISWMSLSEDGRTLLCLEQGPVLRQVDLRTNEVLTCELDDDLDTCKAFHDAECNMSHLHGTRLFLYRYSFTELLPVFVLDLSKNWTASTFSRDMARMTWRVPDGHETRVMVRFIVRGQVFWADRRVLSCRSEYFRKRINGGDASGALLETPHHSPHVEVDRPFVEDPVEISDMSPTAFQALLRYLLTDQLVVPPQQLELLLELIRVSDEHEISRLSKMCERALIKNVSPTNILDLLVLTNNCTQSMRPLRRALFSYACDHWGEVLRDSEATVRNLVARGEPLMAELLLRCPMLQHQELRDV